MFDNINVNLRKNEGFLTFIPCIPIPEYGQSNAPSMSIILITRTVQRTSDASGKNFVVTTISVKISFAV